MMLDQLVIRAFADKGEDFNAFVADAVTQTPRRFGKGLLMVSRHIRTRLRRSPPVSVPALVSVLFLGLAALPVALALGLSA